MSALKPDQVIGEKSFEIFLNTLLAVERGCIRIRQLARMKKYIGALIVVICLGDPLGGYFVHIGLFPFL